MTSTNGLVERLAEAMQHPTLEAIAEAIGFALAYNEHDQAKALRDALGEGVSRALRTEHPSDKAHQSKVSDKLLALMEEVENAPVKPVEIPSIAEMGAAWVEWGIRKNVNIGYVEAADSIARQWSEMCQRAENLNTPEDHENLRALFDKTRIAVEKYWEVD